ncbi:MAG: DUF1849 family protein [Salaquimonas sp.]
MPQKYKISHVPSSAFTGAVGISMLAIVMGMNFAANAEAAGFEILKPHRAIYDIVLKDAADRSGISSMNGRIVYEMEGNECDGISVRYRFVSKVSANGDIFTTDQQTASYEAPDGNHYTFLTKSFVNERLDRTVKGNAEIDRDSIKVDLDSPEVREVELPVAKFISTHLVEAIEKARAGVPFFQTDVFDGGDQADEILKTSNIIGKPSVVGEILTGEDKDAVAMISDQESWPVTIAYFDNKVTNSTEPLPVYEVSFLLYEGGISRRLVMSYPDYSIKGTLVALEYLDKGTCTMEN